MKRIWIINQFANTNKMPGHTRQYDLSIYLKENGFLVSVFASDFNLSLRKFLKKKNKLIYHKEVIEKVNWYWLSVFGYKSNNWRRYLNMISFNLNLFINLFLRCFMTSFTKKKPSIIIASSPQLPAALVGLIIAKIYSIPLIFEVRDLWPRVLIDIKNYNANSFYVKILFIIENLLYKHSSLVVVLSKGCVNYVKNKGAKNVKYLSNGPDLKLFRYYKLPTQFEEFSEKRPFRIIYSGAHGLVNGLENVIEAAKLLEKLPILFYFLGDGQEKNNLIKYASDLKSIIFKDPISQIKIPKYLSRFDAIIVSLSDIKLFRYGVSPNKLYDAYALGRPVITTIPGLINDEVKEYKIGVTAKAENPDQLASAIKDLFYMPREEREKMSLRARKLAETNYSRKYMCEGFLKEINKLS